MEGGEIVLGKLLGAVRARDLPRRAEGIDLPRVHGHVALARGAVAVGPHHPRAFDRGAEHGGPQFLVGAVAPGLRGGDGLVGLAPGDRVGGEMRAQGGGDLRREKDRIHPGSVLSRPDRGEGEEQGQQER